MSGAVFVGQLRRRVSLQTPASTTDDSGFRSTQFVSGPQIWAQIRPLQMSGRYAADRLEGVVTHDLVFRAIPDFKAGCRFVYGARIFNVISFEECEGLPLFIRASCEEIVP